MIDYIVIAVVVALLVVLQEMILNGASALWRKIKSFIIGRSLKNSEGTLVGMHSMCVYALAISQDGKTLFSGSGYSDNNDTLKMWNIDTRKCLATFLGTQGVHHIVISPDGKTIALRQCGAIHLWDIKSRSYIESFHKDNTRMLSYNYSAEGVLLALGSEGGSLYMWEVISGDIAYTHKTDRNHINAAVLNDNCSIFAFVTDECNISVVDIATGMPVTISQPDECYHLVFSPDNNMIASGHINGLIKLWGTENGRLLFTLKDHSDKINCLAFHPDGKMLASASGDGKVKVWDIINGKLVTTFTGHKAGVDTVVFSPDGKFVVSGGAGHCGVIKWSL